MTATAHDLLEPPMENGPPNPSHRGCYYRLDYGPVTLLTVDSSNGLPDGTPKDSNYRLAGEGPEGGEATDFQPGSAQYAWLEEQLAKARARSKFRFVQFHHAPYSAGPHGLPPGEGGSESGKDEQSGVPLRVLTPLLMQHGVAAVFSGHDEMYEHSVVERIHFFDVGVAGDGLRGPMLGRDGSHLQDDGNPHQYFLAHLDAPEQWQDGRLREGGKHYGHMEVNVFVDTNGRWKAELSPVYLFPVTDRSGHVVAWERRVYDDVTTILGPEATTSVAARTVTGPSSSTLPLPAGGSSTGVEPASDGPFSASLWWIAGLVPAATLLGGLWLAFFIRGRISNRPG